MNKSPSRALRVAGPLASVFLLITVAKGYEPPPDIGGVIKGTLVVNPELIKGNYLPIPDLKVTATDTGTGVEVGSTGSDIDGRFDFLHFPPGRYKICWEGADFPTDCLAKPVSVASMNVGLGPIAVTPKSGKGLRLLHGRVRLADGSLCTYRDGKTHLGDIATVGRVDRAKKLVGESVRTNRLGEYVLVADTTRVTHLRAECGPVATTRPISASSATDLVVKERRPQIVSLAAYDDSRMVRGAVAGSVVELRVDARDADGDPLEASWSVTGGSVTPVDELSAKWKLPRAEGTYVATTSVSMSGAEGGGARAEESLYFRVGPPIVRFGGTAKSESGNPLTGLRVTVDGTDLKTDDGGRFFGSLKPNSEARLYVLNIEAKGHVPISEVMDHGTLNAVYVLQPAEQRTFPPGDDVTLRDEKSQISIHFRGGSLARSNGGPPVGDVTATFAFIDPTERAMPGDYAATRADGEEAYLDSYGAVYVGLEDAAGNDLDLTGGHTARVDFPMPAAFAKSPPPQIPIWSYDEKAGTWREETGVVADLNGSTYTAKVKHFSFVNMDIAVGAAACMRVKPVFQQLPAPAPRLRMTAPQANGGQKTKLLSLDDPINVVFRLLPDQPVQLEVIDLQGNVFGQLRVTDDFGVPLDANAVDPGGDITPQFDPATWNGRYRPPAPYEECGSTVVLMSGSDAYADPRNLGFLSFEGAKVAVDSDCSDGDCDQGAIEAEAYYKLIDPDTRVSTLGQWWSKNGFDPVTGRDEDVEVAYLNAGDLGSGRNMRCRADNDRVACYVGNYGAFDLQPGNADLAQTADQADAFATVCMEYAPVSNTQGFIDINDDGQINADDKIVKFFVYAGGDSASPRITAARLDNTYARYNPRICMTCHGGELPEQALSNAVLNGEGTISLDNINVNAVLRYMNQKPAIFREFDSPTFGAPTGGLDHDAIKTLNCDIITQTPLPEAITEVINGWYEDCGDDDSALDDTFVPPGWGANNQPDLYSGVVEQGCRACHLAQEKDYNRDGVNDFDFDTFEDWTNVGLFSIEYPICDSFHMPHAEVTFNKFWFNLTPQGEGAATLQNNPLTSFADCNFKRRQ